MIQLPPLPVLEEVNDFDSAKSAIDLLVRYLKDLVTELEVKFNE